MNFSLSNFKLSDFEIVTLPLIPHWSTFVALTILNKQVNDRITVWVFGMTEHYHSMGGKGATEFYC